MKAISLFVVCAAALLTGCATRPDAGVDSAKIDAINRVATARGVDVHWVNYPQRRDTAPAATPATGT
jgi:uncharacterized lipoprotein YajG